MTLIYLSIIIISLFAFLMLFGALHDFFTDDHSHTLSLSTKSNESIELDCYQPLFSTDLVCTEIDDNDLDILIKECDEVMEETRRLLENRKIRKLPG